MRWKDTSPTKLFEIWPGKAVYWELTCMLEADWYIVPQTVESEYLRDAVRTHPGRAEIIQKYTRKVTDIESISFEDYDLVISFDAILDVPPSPSVVFGYYAQEHWDPLYGKSLRQPAKGYDLFLAHMMDGSATISRLPQAVSFPYTHDLALVRSILSQDKQERTWVDWRTLMTLAMKGLGDVWDERAAAAAVRLQEVLELPILHRGSFNKETYAFSDPPAWGDAFKYLESLATCKYYVGVGNVAGAGQSLAEAATLGCICIGQSDKVYHRLICHPSCLCEDIAEMPRRLQHLQGSTDLQGEILASQDENLERHFRKGPLDLLAQAIELKTGSRSTSGR
jgi:hypothetical protein